jgi:hypothetical protein
MAIHTVRDYLTQNQTTVNRQWIPGYLIGIFMRRILGYTYVGDTNYPINPVGTMLIATADSTPTAATPTFAVGTRAGINQGTGREFYVWVPPSTRVVSVTDVGRLLVLKSTANSTFNSGIFLITGFEALNYSVLTTSGTGVSPIQVQTTATNTLTTGQTVTIASVGGNTNANGTFTITVINSTTFTLNGTTGNGNYTSGGTVQTNTYIIDYRTMGPTGFPPQEAFDSMNWYLYEADSIAPVSGTASTYSVLTTSGTGVSPIQVQTTTTNTLSTGQSVTITGVGGNTSANGTFTITVINSTTFTLNGTTGNGNYTSGGTINPTSQYRGTGNSTTPRIMLLSPHPVGFQVRLCHETFQDYSAGTAQGNGNVAAITCIPGFGGTAFGDFPIGGQHLHTAQFYNSSSYASYAGMTPGFGDDSAVSGNLQFQSRITIVGDDGGQAVCIFVRREFAPGDPLMAFCIFGLPDNEPTPLPINNAARLFVYGSGQSTSPGNGYGAFLNNIGFYTGNIGTNQLGQGVSQSLEGLPCSSLPSMWAYVTGGGQGSGPQADGSATDSPWLNATELTTVDIFNGTVAQFGGGVNSLPFEPRIIGTMPLVRCGRANFNTFMVTTDSTHSWQNMNRAVFVTWNGPQVIP